MTTKGGKSPAPTDPVFAPLEQAAKQEGARAWVVVKTCMKQFFFYVSEIAHMWKYSSEKMARRKWLEGQGFKP